MQFKVKTMANIIKFKPGDFAKIHFLDTPVDKKIFKTYVKKAEHFDTTFTIECPWCEDEQIHSRFEILDL